IRLRNVKQSAEGLGAFHEAAQFGQPFSAVLVNPQLIEVSIPEFAARLEGATPGMSVPLVSLGESDVADERFVTVSQPIERRSLYKALLQVLGPDDKQLEKKQRPKKKEIPALSGRVLVVEDNENNQRIVSAMLRKFGLSFELADNGQVALDTLQTAEFDLILMDMQMPVLNGLDAARRIRESDEQWQLDIPIVALTANALPEDKKACMDAGMNDFLTKPIRRRKLQEVLQKWLEKNTSGAPRVISADVRARL
nr:response regulator [Gammaproteobacteria bacterium]